MHVVTGASSGIGRGIAHALASRARMVLAVARSDDATPEAVPTSPTSRQTKPSQSSMPPDPRLGCDYERLDTGRLIQGMAVHVTAPIDINQRLVANTRDPRVERRRARLAQPCDGRRRWPRATAGEPRGDS
jgi:NAD(P)-dependent dehydrogenase (short-subunit alcohol dehydrogenase family)